MRLTEKTRQSAHRYVGDLEKELWRVNWRQHGLPYCGIYAVSPDNRWPTKIGISQNPVKRLISLQNSHWRKLDIWEYRYAENFVAARKIEAKAHEMLRSEGKCLQGEWFDIRPDKALEVIEFAAMTLGVEICSAIPNNDVALALSTFSSKANLKAHVAHMDELEDVYSGAGT